MMDYSTQKNKSNKCIKPNLLIYIKKKKKLIVLLI